MAMISGRLVCLARRFGFDRLPSAVDFDKRPAQVGRGEVGERGVSDDIRRFINDQLAVKSKADGVDKRSIDNKQHNLVQVEGIPKTWTEGDIQAYFDPQMKTILSAKHMLNKFGKPTGRSIIEMKDRISAAKFVDRYNNDFIETDSLTSPLRARTFDLQSRIKAFKAEKLDRTAMIYDLAFEATSKDISDLARDFGEIRSMYMPMRTADKNKGYCVIEFDSQQTVKDFVFKCSGMSLFGRELKFKTGSYSFAQKSSAGKDLEKGVKSSLVVEKAERQEVKIRNTINDLIDAEIKEYMSASDRK